MITLFAMPKRFAGHIGVIQRNAIRSWTKLRPQAEILLFGDDQGTAEFASELGLRHFPSVKRNSSGTPLISDFFAQAAREAREPLLCYINADIILLSDFPRALARLAEWQAKFLACGQRLDLDIDAAIDFETKDWETRLRERGEKDGFLRPPNWIDYFIFNREYVEGIPPFAIGRTCWDNWLIWHALDLKMPVVDISREVTVVHQNHDYGHHKGGAIGVWQGDEAKENMRLSGGRRHLATMQEATHVLGTDGVERRESAEREQRRRYWTGLRADLQIAVADATRPLRSALGLRRKSS